MSSDNRPQQRLQAARSQEQTLNGIDYLVVLPDRQTLQVHLLRGLSSPDAIAEDNVRLFQGDRFLPLVYVSVSGNRLIIRLTGPLDEAIYRLQLVNLKDFDELLSILDFTTNGNVQCHEPTISLEKQLPLPAIDYLAKDYASFRQLMLDRLTVTLPQWKERSPADIGILLVELMAYVGDRLSYYQDAVATEAYLGTARGRVSLRRHARLLDYFLHQGCNARAWIALEITSALEGRLIPLDESTPPALQFFTQVQGLPPDRSLNSEEIRQAIAAKAQVFEPLEALILYEACNEISFYTWGEEEYSLPVGATRATFKDTNKALQNCLIPGRVLILEEASNPVTGRNTGVDRSHRQAVRLTKVTPKDDPLFAENVVEVEWGVEDGLTFSLCLAKVIDNQPRYDLAIARGNVLLADCGRTVPTTFLTPEEIEQRLALKINEDPSILDEDKLNTIPDNNSSYRPQLKKTGREFPLTYQGYGIGQEPQRQWVRFDSTAAASTVFRWEMKDTRPAIHLQQQGVQLFSWQFQPDLLNSDRFAREFVVEVDENNQAFLRFGNDDLGKLPEAGTDFIVSYRVGNGIAGNVGADTIVHWTSGEWLKEELKEKKETLIKVVRNPLPAKGGTDPEPIAQIRLDAPQAFRVPLRAVTPDDYAQKAQEHPQVQRAVATRRWTGSWYTLLIAVDRLQGKPLDDRFKKELLQFLEPFRLAGHELAIIEPNYVPLDIALTVQLEEGYYQSEILQALSAIFSNQSGFFAPDRLTFGQAVYSSQIVQQAMQVTGVRSVALTRFQRLGSNSNAELKTGKIAIAPLEIARLDNDPSAPRNGRLSFEWEGGL